MPGLMPTIDSAAPPGDDMSARKAALGALKEAITGAIAQYLHSTGEDAGAVEVKAAVPTPHAEPDGDEDATGAEPPRPEEASAPTGDEDPDEDELKRLLGG